MARSRDVWRRVEALLGKSWERNDFSGKIPCKTWKMQSEDGRVSEKVPKSKEIWLKRFAYVCIFIPNCTPFPPPNHEHVTCRIVLVACPTPRDDHGRSSFGFEENEPPPASRVRNAGRRENPAGGGGSFIGAVSLRRKDFRSDLDVYLNDIREKFYVLMLCLV